MNREQITSFINKTIVKTEANFYKLLVEGLDEEITVTDGEGVFQYANQKAVEVIGMPVYDLIGKNASELEERGYLKPSCTLEVLRQRKKVHLLQKLKDGRVIIASGMPIFDKSGEEIIMVISTSRDVEEVNDLMAAMNEQREELQLKNAEIERLRDDMLAQHGFIYADPTMRAIRDAIIRIAPLDVTVLVEGETGVGKEVIVKTLHKLSNRSGKPFVKINCGLIPENLIESEFFGYEEGAFTGASKTGKKGLIEVADGGTLFLDEIGEMPLHMQVKLLDFIQDNVFKKVGGTTEIRVDVRIVAATNRNLHEMCEKGYFRKDLYYRLKVMPLTIPPLRDRSADIRTLARTFMSNYNEKYNTCKTIDAGACAALTNYYWPGNVRELEHVVERAFIMTDDNVITKETVQWLVHENRREDADDIICREVIPLRTAKQAVEKQLVLRALSVHGSTYKVAKALDVDQSTVVKIMKRHGISKPWPV